MPANTKLFNRSVRQIEKAYSDLGHNLGWRFLYTPRSTFSRQAPLWFVGLNPGGKKFAEPSSCTKRGNAYRLERWGGATEPNRLQSQVIDLYVLIANRLEVDHAKLMDQSLAANFCPFRSPSWTKLTNKPKSIEFCTGLWTEIVRELEPRVIVTIAPQAFRSFNNILKGDGYRIVSSKELPAGWGNICCARTRLRKGDRDVLLIRFPHFSRFSIIGRKTSMPTVRKLVNNIAEMIE